ncbi:MAG: NHL repeat-containing protein [Thiobacillus sp.]
MHFVYAASMSCRHLLPVFRDAGLPYPLSIRLARPLDWALHLALALLLIAESAAVSASGWQTERWGVADFAGVLGGGPDGGPVEQAGGTPSTLCGDQAGNLYLVYGQFIDIVTPDGMRSHLAGTGEPGFRDGAAHQAEFRLGLVVKYRVRNLACGPDGSVYVADGGNGRIRRIHQANGQWRVDTWAGGGKRRLGPGESAPPNTVAFSGTLAVAVTPQGEVTLGDDYGAYRMTADGREIRYLARWPASALYSDAKSGSLNVMMGDADRAGNVYFVSRTPDAVIRITPAGKVQHVAGLITRDKAQKRAGDGPPLQAFFNTPDSIAVEPDGSAIYVCGGDEYNIRRIPGDGAGNTATLMQNGQWYRASVHPNKSRGPAVVKPAAKGRLKPDGDLTILVVSHLLGRDAQGNLYGMLNRWSGMTQVVEGEGLLGTRVFRLRRSMPGGGP